MMLSDKVIVIAGGAGVLGRRFSSVIAAEGAVAIVADVNASAAGEVADKIHAAGHRAEAAHLDITNTRSVQELIVSLDSRHGRIDAVVNSGYPRNKQWGRKVEDVTYSDFCENVSLHLGGYFLVTQQFASYFRAHGGGNIVNLGSIYGTMAPRFGIYAGTPMTTPVEYAAIKAAVIQLSRYFAQRFKDDAVRVNTLSPGGILDGQPESFTSRYDAHCGVRGMLQPDDVAGSLVFLLSDASKYMTGQNLVVDDGYSL